MHLNICTVKNYEVQILLKAVYISVHINILGERHKSICSSSIDKQDRLGSLALIGIYSKRRKTLSQARLTLPKNSPCITSCLV